MKSWLTSLKAGYHFCISKLSRLKLGRLTWIGLFIFMTFFDKHSFIDTFKRGQQVQELKAQIQVYDDMIKDSQAKLKKLNTDENSLEKFAREEFLMKQPNEDIFLIDSN